jgi:sulfoxide reductase heme-binding subunit YedZ
LKVESKLRIGVFILLLSPFAWLVYAAGTATLGPDPAEAIMHVTGEWSLRALVLVLLLPLLRQWSGWPGWLRLGRMLGLYAFFYSCVHLASFSHFYIGWTPAILAEELAERPYITLGFAAWLCMLPLALTSTRGMQRRLRRNWKRLHRLVYPAALLASLHLLWQARSDVGEALIYLVPVLALLAWRVRHRSGRPDLPAASPWTKAP